MYTNHVKAESHSSFPLISLLQNPGYYDIRAEDVAVWHVPNNERMDGWKLTSFLRYHTESRFLSNYGGNLYNLFKVLFIAHGEFALFKVSSCYEN